MTAGTPRRRRPARAATVLALALPALLGPALPAPASAAPPSAQTLDELRRAEQQAQVALDGSTAAAAAAAAEVARVAAELPGAERAASVARGELAGARAKAAAARAAAERAEQARAAKAAEVDRADAEVERTRDAVDALARMSYQRGRLGGIGEVMAATAPQDALVRGEMLRSVFRSGTASLDRVTSARLALAATRAQLAAEEKAAAAARAAADQQEARAGELSAAADAAVQRVQALVADRQAALGQAEAAREDDRRAYLQAQAESAALAERIRREAAAAAARAAARAAAERAAAERAARSRGVAPPPPAPAPAARPSSSRLLLPTEGRLSSDYGWRTHPIYGDRRFHGGWDIAAPEGTPVYAADDGVVLISGTAGGYGLTIVLDHGGDLTTMYAHQSQLVVREGQAVRRGQLIGRVGSTGNSTGNHLHWEVRVDGEPVDPDGYAPRP